MSEKPNTNDELDLQAYLDKVEDYLNSSEADSLRLEVDKNLTFGTDLKSLILEQYKDRVQDVLIFLETIKHCMILVVIRKAATISTIKEDVEQTNQQDIDIGLGFMEEAAKYNKPKPAPTEDTIVEALKLSVRLLYSDNNSRTGAEIMSIVNDAYGRDVVLKLRSMQTEDILRRLQNM